MQRDARIWPEPEQFRPERFLDGKAPVYQFFPFGAGVWRCLGAQFAEYEMRVVLARLVAQLDLTLDGADHDQRSWLVHEKGSEPMQRGFTVAPADGLPLGVSARQPTLQQDPDPKGRHGLHY